MRVAPLPGNAIGLEVLVPSPDPLRGRFGLGLECGQADIDFAATGPDAVHEAQRDEHGIDLRPALDAGETQATFGSAPGNTRRGIAHPGEPWLSTVRPPEWLGKPRERLRNPALALGPILEESLTETRHHLHLLGGACATRDSVAGVRRTAKECSTVRKSSRSESAAR